MRPAAGEAWIGSGILVAKGWLSLCSWEVNELITRNPLVLPWGLFKWLEPMFKTTIFAKIRKPTNFCEGKNLKKYILSWLKMWLCYAVLLMINFHILIFKSLPFVGLTQIQQSLEWGFWEMNASWWFWLHL